MYVPVIIIMLLFMCKNIVCSVSFCQLCMVYAYFHCLVGTYIHVSFYKRPTVLFVYLPTVMNMGIVGALFVHDYGPAYMLTMYVCIAFCSL